MASAVTEKFRTITCKPYAEQAKWYLNAFWADIQNSNPEEPEEVWKAVEAFIAVDHKNGKNGNELNEVCAHHFLQKIGRVLTALELRAELRKIDLDANGEMALVEYLLFQYKRDVAECCNNPQGGGADPAELKAAEEKLNAISKANDELQEKLVAQKALEAASKEAEAKVKAAEDAVREAEAEAKAVEAALQAEQDKYDNECTRLSALSTDETVGIVKRNMAVQQLAQLKGSDPLPLQKAKITQGAVVRRVAKAREAAEAETAKAVSAREAAEEGTRQIELAVADMQKQMKEAEDALKKLKMAAGAPHGAIWWMEREIAEKKKYLPQRYQ